MCYEYDWMQKPQADEERRKNQEKADLLKKQTGSPPPKTSEPPRTKEPVPA